MSTTASTPTNVRTLVGSLLAAVPHGKRRLAAAIALSVLASGASVALMGVSAWLLSRAAEHPPVLYLQVAAVSVRFFGTSRGVFRYVERLVSHDLALRMQEGLRLRTYETLSRTTLLGRRHGDLLVRVTADVEAIMDVVVRVVLPFLTASVVLLGTTTILTMFSPGAAAVLLVTSLLAGIGLPLLARRLSRDGDAEAASIRGELADRVHELAHAAGEITAYGATDTRLTSLMEVDARLRRTESRAAWTRGLAAGGQLVAAGIAVAAALVIGGQAVADGTLLGRDLAVLCLTPLALHEMFADLTKAAQTLTSAQSALGRVVGVLTEPPVGRGDRVVDEDAPSTTLLAADLTIGWPGGETVARHVSLDVPRGRRVAVVGPSGIGKTTLAATVLGLIPPLDGTLEAPERIGYLAQDAHLFATTLSENVRIGNRSATPEQVSGALTRAGLDLDPARLIAAGGTTLSGGEARRVALARLLVADTPADLVILDEPTEHLDHDTAAALMDDLLTAMEDTPLLIVTHDPGVMAQCDEVLELTPDGLVARRSSGSSTGEDTRRGVFSPGCT